MLEIIPDEQSFRERVLGHDCGNRDIVYSESIVAQSLVWICMERGWGGQVRASSVRQRKFSDWALTREGRIKMTRKASGALVVEEEVEL